MLLGIDTIVIDLEDAKKLLGIIEMDRRTDKKFYETLSKKDLLKAFSKFKEKIKELEDLKDRIYIVEKDDY